MSNYMGANYENERDLHSLLLSLEKTKREMQVAAQAMEKNSKRDDLIVKKVDALNDFLRKFEKQIAANEHSNYVRFPKFKKFLKLLRALYFGLLLALPIAGFYYLYDNQEKFSEFMSISPTDFMAVANFNENYHIKSYGRIQLEPLLKYVVKYQNSIMLKRNNLYFTREDSANPESEMDYVFIYQDMDENYYSPVLKSDIKKNGEQFYENIFTLPENIK